MRRLGLIGLVAVPLLVVALGSLSTSAEASSAVQTPGPPTDVQATSTAGVRGVTVSWGAPVSDGGAPILYYGASTYNGQYRCMSFAPSPDTCHIDGLRVYRGGPSIRVKAFNAKGRGSVVVVLPAVTGGNTGNGGTATSGGSGASTSTSSGTSQAGGDQTPSSSVSDVAGGPSSGSAASTSGIQAELPFTGVNVATLFVVGLSLVLGGLLVLRLPGRRKSLEDNVTLTSLVGTR